MKKNSTSLFYLHDEGGFYFQGEYDEAVKKVYPEEFFESEVFKKIFFWGARQKQVFKNHPQEEKFLVTGSPRFDLLKSDFAHIDTDKVADLKKKYGRFVLVCTRFGAVNRVPDEPTTLSKRSFDIRVEGGALQKFSEDEVLETMYNAWEKISFEFTHFVPTLARIAKEFPDTNFVIRPHPAERTSFYSDSFSHFKNVFIDKSGDVRPYIRASEVVIHSECTTGVEAEIAGKPNINFRPCKNIEKYEGFSVAGVSDVGICCNDYQSLRASLEAVLEKSVRPLFEPSNTGEYLENSKEDVFAFDKIVEALIDERASSGNNSYVPPQVSVRNLSKLQISRLLKNKLRIIRDVFINRRLRNKGDSKFYHYSGEEIQRIAVNLGVDNVCVRRKGGNIWVAPLKTWEASE
jgi:surface carbohydrate biosynthesis protein